MNKEFAQKVFDAAKETGFSPAFVTAMTCIETGWGRNGNGNYNLFAELAPKEWTGKKNLVRVTRVVVKIGGALGGVLPTKIKILPELRDVIYSLVMDADAFEYDFILLW